MHVRHSILLAAVLLGVVAVPVFGADAGAARSCSASVATVENVTTSGISDLTATGVMLDGEALVSGTYEVTGWFQYRAVRFDGDWRTTDRTVVRTDACGRARFEAPLTGLVPNTSYEFRAVVVTDDDTASGEVKRFRTDPSGPTSATVTPTRTPRRLTRTPTPDPCPNFRGAGALCTRTPTPTPHVDPGVTPTGGPDDVQDLGPGRDPGIVEWVGGLLPTIAWIAAVVIVAPLVLGGLLGLDSLRGAGGG